jgi:hypothetical protein
MNFSTVLARPLWICAANHWERKVWIDLLKIEAGGVRKLSTGTDEGGLGEILPDQGPGLEFKPGIQR